MKSLFIFFITAFFVLSGHIPKSYGQGNSPYVTIWQIDNDGITGSNSIRIPAYGEFTYTWEEDGNPSNSGSGSGNNTTDIDFPSIGKYKVSITPSGTDKFNRICFVCNSAEGGDAQKLVDIISWGDVHWSSMAAAYQQCSNLTLTATDLPDLSGVTSMNNAFTEASGLIGTSLSGWDVSTVTNLKAMFKSAYNFNVDISGWDVSNVTDMSDLFSGASNFNQDINGWDVSKVTDMSGMFYHDYAFNQNLNSWDVSHVTDMELMFTYAMGFNGDISSWDVSNVTSMYYMFDGAQSFNQNIGNWDVSKVTNMDFMFAGAMAFNQNLGRWNLASVTSAYTIFQISGLDCLNYGRTLAGWAANPATPSNLNISYSAPLRYGPPAVAARNYLVSNLGWAITNDVFDPSCDTPLPVTLVSFDVAKAENSVRLFWETSSETNNSHFEIEWSADARKFNYLGSVAGNGNGTSKHTYSYTHDSPVKGQNYYRLKQVDFDGKYTYSSIRTIRIDLGNIVTVYPNPSSKVIKITGLSGEQLLKVDVYDEVGKIIAAPQTMDGDAVSIGLEKLSSGIYFVKIQYENGQKFVHRFVKADNL